MKIDALLTSCYQASLSMMMPYETGDKIDVDSHYRIETKSRKVNQSSKCYGEEQFFSFLGYGVVINNELISFSQTLTPQSNSYIFTDSNVERQINNIINKNPSFVRFIPFPLLYTYVKYKNS